MPDDTDQDERDYDTLHALRVEQAYKKGKDRNEAYQKDPSKPGGPKDDGYDSMGHDEKEAYKRGHRGD